VHRIFDSLNIGAETVAQLPLGFSGSKEHAISRHVEPI
jgi:hypothetical protein